MIRVAAVGDLHFGPDAKGSLRPHLDSLSADADVLLLAGDLTRVGDPAEALALVEELEPLDVPTVGVLGNHDYHAGADQVVRTILEASGVRVLEGETAVVETRRLRIGVAGTKGFAGGFADGRASDFGEPEMKSFIAHSRSLSANLRRSLLDLDTDLRIALLHYSPVADTLVGENPQVYPFLGSYLFGEAVDTGGADLAIHGHAHRGSEVGTTPGGIPVRNVAQPVIGRPYNVYALGIEARSETPA